MSLASLRAANAPPADLACWTRLLLVSRAAGVVDADAPKTAHYLDDVQVHLITHPAPLP